VIKIARITTVPFAFVHIKDQIRILKDQGYDITLITCVKESTSFDLDDLGVKVLNVNFSREINLWKDFRCLIELTWILLRNRFDIIHSSTPKAGLITALAGILSFSKVRIHTFTGQRWQTLKGIKKKLLMLFDRLIVLLNSKCFTDSPSQSEFLIKNKIGSREKVSCIGDGSFGGVDFGRFDLKRIGEKSIKIKEGLKISEEDFVFIYVGRVVKDKGINELVESFLQLKEEAKNLKLVIVGPLEVDDPIEKITLERINNCKDIVSVGYVSDPETYIYFADVFCIPSYREGFGTAVIEAAALNVPSIGTDIPGLRDSIKDLETGYLVGLKEIEGLTVTMKKCLREKIELKKMGERSRERAERLFSSKVVSEHLIEAYKHFF